MYHPNNRAERRHNGDVWRNRQRSHMLTWSSYRLSSLLPSDPEDNRTWWARKQSSAHGNRCMCNYEKHSRREIRKRRRALDQALIDNIKSWI